jgi:hypothetical protein
VPAPLAVTLKEAVPPSTTVCELDWLVISGEAAMVSAAAAEVVLLVVLPSVLVMTQS